MGNTVLKITRWNEIDFVFTIKMNIIKEVLKKIRTSSNHRMFGQKEVAHRYKNVGNECLEYTYKS